VVDRPTAAPQDVGSLGGCQTGSARLVRLLLPGQSLWYSGGCLSNLVSKGSTLQVVSDRTPVLDLHGLRHDQVEHEVYHFLHENNDNMPCKIIVGMSDRMRKLVGEILEELALHCHDERFQNPGCLVIYKTNWWSTMR